MEELIKRVQEQLDNNWAVDAKDIQRLVNSYIMQNELLELDDYSRFAIKLRKHHESKKNN